MQLNSLSLLHQEMAIRIVRRKEQEILLTTLLKNFHKVEDRQDACIYVIYSGSALPLYSRRCHVIYNLTVCIEIIINY